MQIRTKFKETEMKNEMLRVLEKAINNGLTNMSMDFFTQPKEITFGEYISAIDAEGHLSPNDKVPAGLLIWGEDNFVGSPSAVFYLDDASKVAFYELNTIGYETENL